MRTLFEALNPPVPDINGLRYVPDFLTQEEHDALLRTIDSLPWNMRWQRRIQPYGNSYGSNETATPIPDWGKKIAKRLVDEGFVPFHLDQLLVNEYLPGQGISPHADYPEFDRIVVSISLGSGCIMDFARHDRSEKHEIWLEPRSMLIMESEARYEWTHGIAPRKNDLWNGMKFPRGRRVSVTLRKRKT